MAQQPLAQKLALQAQEAVAKYGSITAASHALGIPRGTLNSRIHAASLIPPEPGPDQIKAPLTSFEDAWQQMQRALGVVKNRYKGPPKAKKAGKRLRITAAGDFHVPFHDRDAVAELVAREADTTDLLVIGGDFGDAQSASVFTKYDNVPFKEELAETKVCLETLSEHFRQIKYLRGSNHMDRFEKRIRERLDPDLVDAILYMSGGELSPDLALVKHYDNITIDCWTTPDGQRVPWLMVVGDVAFSHAEKYSRVPGSAMRTVEEWLTDFSGTLGLPEIRAVVQFHTHAMALLPWRSDKVLIEPGCMCHTHGYQLRSKIGGRPQRVGYVTMELENGRVDFDSIRLRWLNRPSERVA
jgi:hypothetical protein